MSSIPVRVNPAAKKDILRRALRIKEAHYGGDHYQVAITLSNLANAHGIFGTPVAKKDTDTFLTLIVRSRWLAFGPVLLALSPG